MNIVVNGALGRMGRRILNLAAHDADVTVTGAVDINTTSSDIDTGTLAGTGETGVTVVNKLEDAIGGSDVVIDFTLADSLPETARICASANTPLVSGITGLTREQHDEVAEIVRPIPCILAPNMSVGVNLLFRIAAETARILGDGYDVEIVEAHHRFKKDAPSGTAKRLAEVIAAELSRSLESDAVYGREGITGERSPNEIGIHAVRAGDIVGEHTVTFATLGERIELTHRAQSRDAFASGAIRAAKFIIKQKPGLYDMSEVLGIQVQ